MVFVEYGSTGASPIIVVEESTAQERGFDRLREKAEFFGYTVLVIDTPPSSRGARYVVDKRSPTWRGMREIETELDSSHYLKLQEWYAEHEHKPVVCSILPIDSDPNECYT